MNVVILGIQHWYEVPHQLRMSERIRVYDLGVIELELMGLGKGINSHIG